MTLSSVNMAGERLAKVDCKVRRLYRSMESRNQRQVVLLSRRLSDLNDGAVSALEKHLAEMELVGDQLKVGVRACVRACVCVCARA